MRSAAWPADAAGPPGRLPPSPFGHPIPPRERSRRPRLLPRLGPARRSPQRGPVAPRPDEPGSGPRTRSALFTPRGAARRGRPADVAPRPGERAAPGGRQVAPAASIRSRAAEPRTPQTIPGAAAKLNNLPAPRRAQTPPPARLRAGPGARAAAEPGTEERGAAPGPPRRPRRRWAR